MDGQSGECIILMFLSLHSDTEKDKIASNGGMIGVTCKPSVRDNFSHSHDIPKELFCSGGAHSFETRCCFVAVFETDTNIVPSTFDGAGPVLAPRLHPHVFDRHDVVMGFDVLI